MNRVFYITTDVQDVFYVKAENEVAAVEILHEEIGKYIFKRNLAADNSLPTPVILGNNIIVGYAVREGALTCELEIEDITPQAYVFANQGEDHWRDWVITEEDVQDYT